ncbi:MAG: protein kinase [Planctomycetes bacterium]|nr:protein kinase [Planctomycetota bacterium]
MPQPAGVCPRCEQPFPASGNVDGLCPNCVLDFVFSKEGSAPDAPTGAGTGAGAGTAVAPSAQPAAANDALPNDSAFGIYHIERLLGRGGMGTVYLAVQTSLGRRVAIKVLPVALAREAEFAGRFEREARAMAALSHPHIVTIHDFGCIEGRFYYAMEYVEGASLRGLLRKGPLPAPRAIAILSQLCDALQLAHRHGVVHRDVKPENVLLDAAERARLADFGLARAHGGDATCFGALTGSMELLGSIPYMAPEQAARAADADARSDIYSLGVVFYEMLTGKLPSTPWLPPSRGADVDPRLDAVAAKALAPAPADRYQDAGQMKQEAARCLPAPVPDTRLRTGAAGAPKPPAAPPAPSARAVPAVQSSPSTRPVDAGPRPGAPDPVAVRARAPLVRPSGQVSAARAIVPAVALRPAPTALAQPPAQPAPPPAPPPTVSTRGGRNRWLPLLAGVAAILAGGVLYVLEGTSGREDPAVATPEKVARENASPVSRSTPAILQPEATAHATPPTPPPVEPRAAAPTPAATPARGPDATPAVAGPMATDAPAVAAPAPALPHETDPRTDPVVPSHAEATPVAAATPRAAAPEQDLAALDDDFSDPSNRDAWRQLDQDEGWGINRLARFEFCPRFQPGWMILQPAPNLWAEDYRGVLLYKTVTGDFVVTVDLNVSEASGSKFPGVAFSSAGLLLRAPRAVTPRTWKAGGENHVLLSLGVAERPGVGAVWVAGTTDSRTTTASFPALSPWGQLQAARIGPAVLLLGKPRGGTWIVLQRYRRADLPATLQVGLTACTDAATCRRHGPDEHNTRVLRDGKPDVIARFHDVRFRRPSLPAELAGKDLSDAGSASNEGLRSILGEAATKK